MWTRHNSNLRSAANGALDLVDASQNRDVGAFGQLVQRYDRKLPCIEHRVISYPGDA